jgi:pSer/pThr/pTyr-binding forkhead associated (FHA) protein
LDEDDVVQAPAHRSADRVTRVLVGKVGEQLLRFPLFKDRLTIGRTEDNDIQLNALFISRRHAVVQTDGDATRVIDWGSKNGVFVNSTRVTEHFLNNGDIVTIGNAHFRYDERPKRDS